MKLGSFTSESYNDGKEMSKVVVLLINVIAFLPFSLPSPSSLLKLPNVSLSPLKKVLLKLRSLSAFFSEILFIGGRNVFQSNVSFLFYSYRGFGTLPRSRFLDVTQRSGERCVTSQKRLRGRLGIWLLSVFSGTC